MAYTEVQKVKSGEWLQVDMFVTSNHVSSRIKPASGEWQGIGSSYSDGRDFALGNAGVLVPAGLSSEVWIKDVNFVKQK